MVIFAISSTRQRDNSYDFSRLFSSTYLFPYLLKLTKVNPALLFHALDLLEVGINFIKTYGVGVNSVSETLF